MESLIKANPFAKGINLFIDGKKPDIGKLTQLLVDKERVRCVLQP